MVAQSQCTFVEAHAHTGKSALIDLLALGYSDRYFYQVVDFDCDSSSSPQPAACLCVGSIVNLPYRQLRPLFGRFEPTIIVVKNADSAYSDKAFWKQLLVDAPREGWLPKSLRFVFLAKPVIGRDAAVPCELLHKSVGRLKPEDILLSDEEAKRELLHAADEVFQGRDLLLEITVRECAGNWLLVQECINRLLRSSKMNAGSKQLDERDFVLEMLKPKMATMWMHSLKLTPIRSLLMRCLGSAPKPTRLTDEDNHEACATLIEHAILEPCGPDGTHVRLLDPLRERTILSGLFPVRSFLPVASLDEVLCKAVAFLTAKNSKDAVISMDAATIRARFLEGLMRATDDECFVCPELARVFPASHETKCLACQHMPYADIYVGGRVEWGIQLRVRLTKPCPLDHPIVCEHPTPFAMRGRYGILKVRCQRTVLVDAANSATGDICVKITPSNPTKPMPSLGARSVAFGGRATCRDKWHQPRHIMTTKAAGPALVESSKPVIPRHARLGEPRAELVQHMRRLLFDDNEPHRLIYLTGPHGIGKSELVWLFRRQLEYDEVDMAWHDVDHKVVPDGIEPLSAATFALRRDARIDLVGNLVDLQPASPSTMHVVFLDDTHVLLEDESFWSALERAIEPKIGKPWLPPNVRFIVAATAFPSPVSLPSILKASPKIEQPALKLSDTQARDFLLGAPHDAEAGSADGYCGQLPRWPVKLDAFADVLIRASNGSIGLLQALVQATQVGNISSRKASESALIQSFFSRSVSARLIKALNMDGKVARRVLPLRSIWSPKTKLPASSVSGGFALAAHATHTDKTQAEQVDELLALEVLMITSDQASDSARYSLEFASPCAKRLAFAFALDDPTTTRPLSPPETLGELMKSILGRIGSLDPADARKSSRDSIVLRLYERFIEELARPRDVEADIYLELLEVFPPTSSEAQAVGSTPHNAISIEIDILYKVDGGDRWGLQVRITDQAPQTLQPPARRFAPGGRYDVLQVHDFLEVDIVLVDAGAELEPSEGKQLTHMVVRYDTASGNFMASSAGSHKRRLKPPRKHRPSLRELIGMVAECQ